MPITTANSVASNFEVNLAVQQLLKILNTAPGFLQLYKNPLVPTPASLIGDFIPANFAGYIPQNLAGQFPFPSKQLDGFYSSTTIQFLFQNTGFPDAVVYGFYVTAGANWYWAGSFANPITIPAGGGVLPMTLTWQGVDLSLALA